MKAENVNMVMGIKEWALLLLLSALWGGSFFFVEVIVQTMPPLTVVLCRVGAAAVILWIFVILSGKKMPSDPKLWGSFFVIGLLNNAAPFSLITWGQTHIDSSLASILNATTPVFSVVLAHFLTSDESLTKNRGAGVALAWTGVAVLIGVDALAGVGMKIAGQVAVLGAAILYAFAAIFGRRFKGIDPAVVSAGMLTASAIMMAPMAFVFEQPLAMQPTMITWAALLSLAAVSTALAYIIYFYILSKAGATNILLVTFLVPVSAIFLGVVILGESPGWNAFAGMGLIFAGLICIDGRLFSKR